jgi:eukaryotic-like serine/threonine-protein kinase
MTRASPPKRLGDYLILRRIGGGGMGVVYEAEHESLKNRVALKVVHPRFRADPKYLRRFHAEARVAAGLHHTNIVSVFDFGDQDGVCYYAMQFIQGQPLDHVLADIRRLRDDGTQAELLRGPGAVLTLPAADGSLACVTAAEGLLTGRFAIAPALDDTEPIGSADDGLSGRLETAVDEARSTERLLTEPSSTLGTSSLSGSGEQRYVREIARVGAQVADAMEYAHQRGVLHRDIKPSNLLLDALGNVWVTDFGLAKLEEGDNVSQSHELVGTLRYMAPERFRGTSGRRGDIYSLGASLYELLALRPPFDDSDQLRLIEQIRTDPPPPPRQIDRNIPRDLETIVLKALAKDPQDRFSSAGELANELRRFVEGRPIRSRPVSLAEQTWRWCKRDPWLAAASISAALLVTVLAVVSAAAAVVYRNQARALSTQASVLSSQARALSVERGRSDAASLDARSRAVDAYTAQARAGKFSRRPGQRFESLEAVSQAVKLLDGLPPGPETASRRETLRDLAIACMALPDLKPTGRVITLPPGVIATAFDSMLTRYALRFPDGRISVRSFTDDREIAHFSARGNREIPVFSLSPDGRYLATVHLAGRNLTVWDVDRGAVSLNDPGPVFSSAAHFSVDSQQFALVNEMTQELFVYDLATGRASGRWSMSGLGDFAFRPDGAQIAVIDNKSKPASCRIVDAKSGRLVQKISLRTPCYNPVWSSDGTTLAASSNDFKIELWDVATGIRRATLEGFNNGGVNTAFHPTGVLVASNSWEGKLRLWDPSLGRQVLSIKANSGPEFSRDGRVVIGVDDRLITSQVDPALEYRTLVHAFGELVSYAGPSVRNDGRVLAVGTNRGAVLWDLATGAELALLPIGNAWHLMFEASGDLITSGTIGVQRWPIRLDPGRDEFVIGPPRALCLPDGLCGISEDRSGRIVAKASHQFAHVATPERTIRISSLLDCRDVAVSPDGEWLATGSHSGHGAQVWRIRDGEKAADLPIEGNTGVEFSPDGKWLVAGSPRPRLWKVGTWREERKFTDVGECFSPDARLTVITEPSKVIRLVEFETGRTLARLESPDLAGGSLIFSPDGSYLVMSTNDGPAVHVWNLRTIRRNLARMGLDWDAPAYSDDDPTGPSASALPRAQIQYSGNAIAEGVELGEKGQWEAAAAAYARAFADEVPELPGLYCQQAIIRLTVGDRAGYRSSCQHLFDMLRVSGNDERWWIDCTAEALALAPASSAETGQALVLARRRADLNPDPASEQTLGLALYRAGRFAEAEAHLSRSLVRNPDWNLHPENWLILAMIHHQLGRPDEARRWLERAERWIANHLSDRPGGVERAIPAGWHFTGGMRFHLRLREARALILAGPPPLPEDVFAPAP